MTWVTGPDCAVMCNLINRHTHTHTHTHTHSTLHGLMGGPRMLGLEEEVTRRVGHGSPCLSNSRLYLFRQVASN